MEFCLPTKLQVLSRERLRVRCLRLDDVLNAFGLFARAARDSRSTSVERGLLLNELGGLRHFIGARVGDEHVARLRALAGASGFTHEKSFAACF